MAKYEIKIVTTADTAATQKVAQEFDKATQATEKTEKGVSKLGLAFQKLAHEVPLAGVAVSALKNPFTLLTIGVGFAIAKFREFSASVDEMAERMRKFESVNLIIKNFDKIIAESKANRKALADSLKEIGDRALTATEVIKGLTDRLEKQFDLEEKISEKQAAARKADIEAGIAKGTITPAAGAQMLADLDRRTGAEGRARGERRLVARQTTLATEALLAREDVRQAQFQLPGVEAEEQRAKGRLDIRRQFVQTHLDDLKKEEAQIRQEWEKRQLRPGEDRQAVNAEFERRLNLIPARRSQLEGLLARPEQEATAATARRTRVEGVLTSGAERLRALGIQQRATGDELSQVRGANVQIGAAESRIIGAGLTVKQVELAQQSASAEARAIAEAISRLRASHSDAAQKVTAGMSSVREVLDAMGKRVEALASQIKRNENR